MGASKRRAPSNDSTATKKQKLDEPQLRETRFDERKQNHCANRQQKASRNVRKPSCNRKQTAGSLSKVNQEKRDFFPTFDSEDSQFQFDCSKEDTSFEDDKINSDYEGSQQGDILGSPIVEKTAATIQHSHSSEQSCYQAQRANTVPLAIKVNTVTNTSLACPETFLSELEELEPVETPQTIQLHTSMPKVEQERFAFSLLPDEILLLIFKLLPEPWKRLVQLRTVCKHWSVLLKDSSLKYGKMSEDLYIMIKNEKKHYGFLRDYLAPNNLREITADMRAILIDWLVEVAEEFRLQNETFFLTVHYVDRYLSQSSITKGKLQLLGITALLVASKYEEIYVPTISDIVCIADNTYTKDEILLMELNLLNALKFDITVCTVKRFVEYFLKTAEDGVPSLHESKQRSTLQHLATYIAELSLVEYKFAIKRPSLVGASIVCLALHALGLTWTYILESESHYSLDDLNGCVQDLWKLFNTAANSKAVYNKYVHTRFDCVSTLTITEPPCHLADAKINFIS